MPSDDILELASNIILQESEAVAALASQLDSSFVRAVDLILHCHGHVLVAGSGTSHPVAARMAHLLSCCGTPALFLHPGDSQHGLSGAVTEKDVLILISKGGETSEVNHLARIAKKRGATLIAITEQPASTLGSMCDLVLRVQAPPDVDPYGMIATGSSLVNCAFGDALCVILLRLRGYTRDEFGETHPGGAVGQKLSNDKKTPRSRE